MVASYGIFHFYYIYCRFKLFDFPWEIPWEVFWGPLGGSGRVLWGALGAHRDGLPVGMRSLRSRGIPTGNPQATRPCDSYISEGISMFAGPPKVVWYHLVSV